MTEKVFVLKNSTDKMNSLRSTKRKQEEPLDIKDLPKDIRNAILNIYPEVRLKSLTLSKRTLAEITDTICAQPITRNEFKDYLEQSPNIFGLFNPTGSYIFTCFLDNQFNTNVWLMQFVMVSIDDNSYVLNKGYGFRRPSNNLTHTIDNVLENYSNNTQIDSISLYRIINKRLGCIKNNPDYAKRNYQNNITRN